VFAKNFFQFCQMTEACHTFSILSYTYQKSPTFCQVHATRVHAAIQVYMLQYKCTCYNTSVHATIQVYMLQYKCTCYNTRVHAARQEMQDKRCNTRDARQEHMPQDKSTCYKTRVHATRALHSVKYTLQEPYILSLICQKSRAKETYREIGRDRAKIPSCHADKERFERDICMSKEPCKRGHIEKLPRSGVFASCNAATQTNKTYICERDL